MAPDRVLDQVGDGSTTTEDVVSTTDQKTAALRLRRLLLPWLSVLGLAVLCYSLGAAVMFFELPTSGFLYNAFVGAVSWFEQRRASEQTSDQESSHVTIGKIDQPEKTFDGFTLYTVTAGTRAFLMNMRGDVVHEWAVAFSQVWPEPPHLRYPVRDSTVYFFSCHLSSNGDLLVVFHGSGANQANGYGLAKLDKDSKIVWRYPENIHHDVDVGEDGTIYAIKQEIVFKVPEGLEYLPTPCVVDYLVMLSPEGVELAKISILEALRDSPYAPLLSSLERPERHAGEILDKAQRLDEDRRRDVLHTNFVDVLERRQAANFPMFKPGQVLISMRSLDAIAVLDTNSRSVVWAARGPWRGQHDSQFLDNGRLLIFDNLGSPKGSRVLEYDPETQAFPWSYSGEKGAPFLSSERGMGQRLPNGNTLIVNSEGGEMFEVTPDKEVVWSRSCRGFLQAARRYGTDQLHFLKGGERARP